MALAPIRTRVASQTAPLCNPLSFIGALTLIFVTFTCTRLLDRPLHDCVTQSSQTINKIYHPSGQYRHYGTFEDVFGKNKFWPDQGYGSNLSLRIYVYEDHEIVGLRKLLAGRDHNIDAESCAKGQWGTQVKIYQFLLKSKFRTLEKEKAQLFFVPTHVKCVRMKGGLNDKEINQTFVQVLQQMPYFRRSGGRDHIFVFPSFS